MYYIIIYYILYILYYIYIILRIYVYIILYIYIVYIYIHTYIMYYILYDNLYNYTYLTHLTDPNPALDPARPHFSLDLFSMRNGSWCHLRHFPSGRFGLNSGNRTWNPRNGQVMGSLQVANCLLGSKLNSIEQLWRPCNDQLVQKLQQILRDIDMSG